MLYLRKIVMVIIAVAFVATLVGCEKEGTGERAGKKIDKAFQNVKDKVKDATK